LDEAALQKLCGESRLILDGIFGTGFSGQLPEKIGRVLRAADESAAHRIALDIPSGMNCDNGFSDADSFRPELTLTFAAQKPAHLLKRSREGCGEVATVEIGITGEILEQVPGGIRQIDGETVREALPRRSADSNKGSYGKLLNIGGCGSMTGAVLLSTESAYRCGVGLVMTAAPEKALEAVRLRVPEAIHCLLPLGGSGAIAPENGGMLVEKLNGWATAGLIGCGMSVTDESKAVVRQLLTEARKPLVIDADGLNCLAATEDGLRLLDDAQAEIVLTPHMLEFARLSGFSVDEIKADRFRIARAFAAEHRVTLVLKDSNTVVAGKDGSVYMNDNGNSGLSKGGSGDLLAGMIGSFLAQGAQPVQAAVCGVYLHAAAGDAAERQLTAYGMLPSDVIGCIPAAFGELLRI
jgi:NAD(P)H-hydrate epimerase